MHYLFFDTRYDQRVSGFIFCENVPKISFLRPLKLMRYFFFAITRNFKDKSVLSYFGGSHLRARVVVDQWLKAHMDECLKPKTWIQLSNWPSLLSMQHYIEST